MSTISLSLRPLFIVAPLSARWGLACLHTFSPSNSPSSFSAEWLSPVFAAPSSSSSLLHIYLSLHRRIMPDCVQGIIICHIQWR